MSDEVPEFLQPKGIEATLAERKGTYGEFDEQARITKTIERAASTGCQWTVMDDDMQEAVHMIASKIARIVNGDPTFKDSWHDIAGYALLIEKRL